MRIKYKCKICGSVFIADSKKVHHMVWCKKGCGAVDLEEEYCRYIGDPIEIERCKD